MLAPVMTIHNMECQKMQKMKDNERAVQLLKAIGPDLFPKPQADGKITSNLVQVTGFGAYSIM
jgi:hypothetical protein